MGAIRTLSDILMALTASGSLVTFVSFAVKHWGKQAREERLQTQRDTAEQQFDDLRHQFQDTELKLRAITEHAHLLRVRLIKAGITPPDWPDKT